jgi:gamma-butyrobetaine dioxygenase
MQGAELAEFAAGPHSAAAVRVGRWDDEAKGPSADVPGFAHYRPLLSQLLQ